MEGLAEYLAVNNSETAEVADPQTEQTETTEEVEQDIEETGGETGTQESEAEVAEQPERTSKQSPEADAAFAQLRRERDQYRQLAEEARQHQEWIKQTYGFNSFQEWRDAIARQQQMAEQASAQQEEARWQQETQMLINQMREDGYDQMVIDMALRQRQLERQIQLQQRQFEQYQRSLQLQAEQAEQQRRAAEALEQMKRDNEELAKKYPGLAHVDLEATLQANPEIVKYMMDNPGVPLKAAFFIVNEAKIADHLRKGAQQKAINNINSKQHLKGESGSDSVDTTVVPPDVLEMYRRMNPKWSLKKIVDDYRRHNK